MTPTTPPAGALTPHAHRESHRKRLRNLVIGMATGVLLASGLVSVTSSPANATATQLRDSIVSTARAELAAEQDASTRKHAASGTCNFYSGYFRPVSSPNGCASSSGVRWVDNDWCADFAKYVWKGAGVTHASEPEQSGGVLTGMAASFKDYGMTYGTWHPRAGGYVPEPGDSLVFDWEGDGVIDHVGIVTSADGSTVTTVEGNAGTPGAVRARSYASSNVSIVGYAAPSITGVPVPRYWVDTFSAAPGYSSPGGTRTGTLFAATNYAYCKVWGPIVQSGSQYNHWWMRTDLDEGSPTQNQYVSAFYLSRWGNDEARDNSGATLPDC